MISNVERVLVDLTRVIAISKKIQYKSKTDSKQNEKNKNETITKEEKERKKCFKKRPIFQAIYALF